MGLSPEQLQRLQERAIERSQRVAESTNKFTTKIVYVPDGVTKFRPYIDKEGEVIRTGFRHKFGNKSVHCLGLPTCKICERLKEVSDSWDNAWRFGSQEFAILYAWIFECSGSSEYIKLNEPIILMGNARLANEISYQLKDIQSLEELDLIFRPEEPSLMWQLRYDRDKKNLSLGFFSRKATMDPLPENFPPLSQVYFKEGVPPTKEKEAEFLKDLENSYSRYLALSGSESSTSAPSPEPKESYEPKESPRRTEPTPEPEVKKSSSSSTFKGKRTSAKASTETPPCFGYHNNSFEDPECLLCKAESKCEIETKKAA